MEIGVLGSGTVGRVVGAKLASLGHEVTIGSRDPAALLARAEKGPMEQETFVERHARNAEIAVVTFTATPFGWKHVVGLGDISTARGTEMTMPLWLRLFGALGTPVFNVSVVS